MRGHPSVAAPWRLVVMLAVGCAATPRADYSKLELVDVTGQVTLDGIALAGARVEFEHADATCSSATTDRLGRYRLKFDSQQIGCLPGRKRVRIRMAPAADDEEDPDAAPTSAVFIPACYHSDSQLTANVSHAERTFDFALLSTQGEPRAPGGSGSR